jgi:outer membrane protein assembly factor BamB
MPSCRLVRLVVLVLALAGCGWFGDNKKPLPGQRYSVLSIERRLEPDPTLAQLDVRLPRPEVNEDWPEPGGYPNHAMQHLGLADEPKRAWRVSVGDGIDSRSRIIAGPVVFGGRIFTMDTRALVRAFDTKNGHRLWEFDAKPDEERGAGVGGGVAFGDERVFVGTGFAQLIALDAATGKEIWRTNTSAPVRGAPTVADGRVYAITVDNELEVFATDDGRKLWNHSGTPELAGLYGGASPAIDGDVVVAPYSSAELFALRVENGRPLWNENLAATRRIDALSTLADIRGMPVIDRGRVYAISHSGRMVAVDLRTGERVWEQDIGGTDTPWVAGDFIYVLTNDAQLFCLTRRDGRVRWATELPRYEKPEKKKGPLQWTGPVLGGDRLIVVGSDGEALSISPYTGQPLGRIELPDNVFVPPIIAGDTLYVLTDDADLIAYR